jgi:hypothetical protein
MSMQISPTVYAEKRIAQVLPAVEAYHTSSFPATASGKTSPRVSPPLLEVVNLRHHQGRC